MDRDNQIMQIQAAPKFNAPKQTNKKPAAKPPTPPQDTRQKVAGKVLGTMAGMAVHTLTGSVPQTVLHELGHAAVAKTLMQTHNMNITINPGQGGMTSWQTTGLTPLGKVLGAQGSMAAVAVAGTAVDALSSVAVFGAGFKMRKKHPILGASMMGYAGATMLNSTMYAASGIGKSLAANAGHDFLTIQALTGIPPAVSAVVLASILPAQYMLLRHWEKKDAAAQG
jgi:hypothetical protein